MAAIAIQKVKNPESESVPVFDEMKRLFGEVERKAFDLFLERGQSLGRALDDWLQAERETLGAPPAELVETPKAFAIRVAVPGFSAKDVQVTATPQEVIVKAEHPSAKPNGDEQLRWSEMPHNGKVCRSIPLPGSVDVEKVAATLDDGMLVIRAPKAAPPKSRQIAVSASA